jgi:hypothetical protein
MGYGRTLAVIAGHSKHEDHQLYRSAEGSVISDERRPFNRSNAEASPQLQH